MSSFLFRSVSKLTVSFPSRNISRRTLQTSTAKVTPFYTNSINTCFGNNNLNSLTIGKRNFHAARINQQHVASLSSIISLTTIKFSLATQSRRALTNITYAQLKQRNIMSVTGHLLSPNNVYPNRDYSSNSSSHDKNDVSESTTTAINSEHSNSHPELTRWSWAWWKEWTIIFIVFGITGSTTVRCVRPLVSNLFGIEGTLLEGPWSYRLTYLSITLPLYSMILLLVGTIAGRHAFFKTIVVRMWGRLIPKRLINAVRRQG